MDSYKSHDEGDERIIYFVFIHFLQNTVYEQSIQSKQTKRARSAGTPGFFTRISFFNFCGSEDPQFSHTKHSKYLRIQNRVPDHIMNYLLILPLLIGLGFGLVDAQAENNDTWYVGEGLKKGDYFSYKLCHWNYNDCQEFQIACLAVSLEY